MKTKNRLTIVLALLIYNLSLIIYNPINAQNIGINGSGANAHSSALLDVDATATPSLGILIPRIALQAINVAAPVSSPATSLLVYNTASASTGTNAVSAGYYYWDGTKWVRFAYSSSGSSANDWNILGNAGTSSSINFIGTTDNQDLLFKRNGLFAGILNAALGNTSFGVLSFNATSTGNNNSAFGKQSLLSNTAGTANTAIGSESLLNNTVGIENTGVGYYTLHSNTTGSLNVAVGSQAMNNNTIGNNNTANGYQALYSNTIGEYNIATGGKAMYVNVNGTRNVASGYSSLFSNTQGTGNVAIGHETMYNNTSGDLNVAIGIQALVNNTTGQRNIAIGNNAFRYNQTTNHNIVIGDYAMGSQNTASGDDNIAIGYYAASRIENVSGYRNVVVGASALLGGSGTSSQNTAYDNVAIGDQAMMGNSGVASTGISNVAVGNNALGANTSGFANTAIGKSALNNNTSGGRNTAVGFQALNLNSTGSKNTALGHTSLVNNTSGNSNTAIGFNTLFSNTTATANVAIGAAALNLNTIGGNNVVIGVNSFLNNISGSDNSSLGGNTGNVNTTGVGNTFIGTNSDATAGTFTNATAIGYNAKVGQSNALILGGTGADAVNVGIGTATPAEKLEVQGSVKIVDGTQGLNKVLTSDAAGKASWKEAAVNTNRLSYSLPNPATVIMPTPGNLITIGSPFTLTTTGIYRVLVDATIPQGMILGIDNQGLSNAALFATVTSRYYAQYFLYITAGTHSLILYNDQNGSLISGGPYWQFSLEGPIN